jgi:hypothetical protein
MMNRFWCELNDLADVRLGYKSLQNEFYYLSRETIELFGIEDEYLRQIFRLPNFDTQQFLQSPVESVQLFYCRKNETDLRGTGALKYIRAMAKRPATMKKQASGEQLTIQEVLQEQGGKHWYAPKAAPQVGNIWLRKAFAGVFAPFLFDTAVVVDQRCNRIVPRQNITWKELAAVMTSSLFSLALEADGACSMGGGALEWKTKSLRTVKVIDLRRFTSQQRSELVKLGEQVWSGTTPVDFSKDGKIPDSIHQLDEYVLRLLGEPVSSNELYIDLHSTVKNRIEKAKTRKSRSRVQEQANVNDVAVAIAKTIQPFLEAHRFPEDFYSQKSASQIIEIPEDRELAVTAEQFMSRGHLKVEDKDGHVIWEAADSAHLIELITRALLLGRRRFAIPIEEQVISKTLIEMLPWLESLSQEIKDAVNTSALGTRFEQQLNKAILAELRIHPSAFHNEVWGSREL